VTLARNADDQERLIQCVRVALAKMDAGEEVVPQEICAEHPHLAGPLAEVLGLTDALPGLQQEALREDPLAGLVLADRYQLRTCLGRGAMGVVYDGEDRELRRDVAVKILDARLFHDEQAEQRFQREAEALAALQHEHVVSVFDRGRTPEGIHYLVMERLDGLTLAALLNAIEDDEPLAVVEHEMHAAPVEHHWPRLCASWSLALARGLGVAHDRGLVHRDVKPSNVFLAQPGRPVLLDFGIAARDSDERLTATQTTLGTPWYMPPEQVAAGAIETAKPTLDVYGLGATLYHLLGNRPPYEGDAAAVLAALPTKDPEPLAKVQPDLPRDLVAIVDKCLEREPQRRYRDANELARDLDAFLQHRPVTARPLGTLARRMRQWRRAPARPIAVLAVLLTLLVAVVAVPVWRQQQREQVQRQVDDLYRTLPSVLAIEGWPDERVLAELRDEHQTAIAHLDRILALAPDDLPVRLWRACLRLDLGDRDGAARDLDAIAGQNESAYFRELAKRYAQSDPDKQGTLAIDLDGLPAPTTPKEQYVAGFHELRNRQQSGFAQRADALLAAASARYLPARDLRLLSIASLADYSSGDAQHALLTKLYDESVALEAIYGRDTARTQAMRGLALLMLGRYQESVAALERSLELRPARHGPHQNLGNAFKRLNRLDEAEAHLRRALELRPFAWNSQYTLAQVLRDRGEFAAAYEIMDHLDSSGSARRRWRHERLVAVIAIAEATALLHEDVARSKAAARRAVESCRRELQIHDSLTCEQLQLAAEALLSGKRGEALVPFLQTMQRDPLDAYQLANLAFLMPLGGLDAEQTAWLAVTIRRIAQHRAEGNAAFVQRLDAEIDQILERFR